MKMKFNLIDLDTGEIRQYDLEGKSAHEIAKMLRRFADYIDKSLAGHDVTLETWE